jgi:hypothetical protein
MQCVEEAIRSERSAGDGPFTKRCQAALKRELGVGRALLATSCTHALEMAAMLLDILPRDEVIAPSFTFVSTVNAFVLRGARPVFADIWPDTLNPDEAQIERCISHRTRAIVPAHYSGLGCEMDKIMEIAAGRRGGRRQRQRAVREIPRSRPGLKRLTGGAKLPRDEELHRFLRHGKPGACESQELSDCAAGRRKSAGDPPSRRGCRGSGRLPFRGGCAAPRPCRA